MRVLFLTCGEPDPVIQREHGVFFDWFRSAVGEEISLHDLDARTTALTSAHLDGFDGVLISGSPHAAFESHPWIPALEELVREAVSIRKLPVFGVCFGHQIVAQALGGRVMRNPRGREIGTAIVRPNDEGRVSALLAGLGDSFRVQLTHRDTVAIPPPGARVLATSDKDGCQAFEIGSAWCVQFHPEITDAIIRSYLRARRDVLASEGIDTDALIEGVEPTDVGKELFRRFAAKVAERRG